MTTPLPFETDFRLLVVGGLGSGKLAGDFPVKAVENAPTPRATGSRFAEYEAHPFRDAPWINRIRYRIAPMTTLSVDERHPTPALAWAGAFAGCALADAALGRWVFVPLFVAAFYAGMVVIDLVAYPLLERWRAWLKPRGLRAWYLAEVGGLWIGTSVILALLAPWWLEWGWNVFLPVRLLGVVLLLVCVGVGAWAVWKMGWARILFAAAMFPPGSGEESIPQRLVVKGPYRYVRNPLYVTDVGVMLGTFIVTGKWFLLVVLAAYLLQLGMQIYFEERELKERFGEPYLRYLRFVPRFVPRVRPVDPGEIHGEGP